MKSITKNIYLIIGFIIIFYIIYIRFIVVRMPKELVLFNPVNIKLLLLVTTSLIVTVIIIIKNIQLLLNYTSSSENILQRIFAKVNYIIDESLSAVYAFILNKINDYYNKISSFSRNFYNTFGKKSEGFFLYINFFIRIIILFAFLIDVFYFFELKYFYKTLILLCIPLSINVLIFILKDFSKNLEETASYLQLNGISDKGEPILIPSKGNEDIDLKYHIEQFRNCSLISGYLEVYDYVKFYYTPRVNLFIYTLYFTGWFYILIINLYFK